MHKHQFPLKHGSDLRELVKYIPTDRLALLELKRDRGCEPEWTVTLHHEVLTHSEVHRILLRMPEGADLVPFLESYHS